MSSNRLQVLSEKKVTSPLTLKPAFTKVRAVGENQVLLFDNFRFEVVEIIQEAAKPDQGPRARSTNARDKQALDKKPTRSSSQAGPVKKVVSPTLKKLGDEVVHLSFCESQSKICLLSQNSKKQFALTMVHFPNLNVTECKMPLFLETKLQKILDDQSIILKVKARKPEVFNKVEFGLYALAADEWLFQAHRIGVYVIGPSFSQCIIRPGFLAVGYTKNTERNLNLVSSVSLTPKSGSLTFEIEALAFTTTSFKHPVTMIQKKATFSFEASLEEQTRFQAASKNLTKYLQLQVELKDELVLLAQDANSLKTAIAINITFNLKIVLIDQFHQQTVIDLMTRVKLYDGVRKQRVIDLHWQSGLLMVTFSQGGFACFTSQGALVETCVDVLYGQSFMQNSQFFNESALQGVHMWTLSPTKSELIALTETAVYSMPCSAILQKSAEIPFEFLETCIEPVKSYPIVTRSGRVLLNHTLYNQPEKVALNTYFALKTRPLSIQLLKQSVHTIFFTLQSQVPQLGMLCLLNLKEKLQELPKLLFDLNQNQSAKGGSAKVFFEGEIKEYHFDYTPGNDVDKTEMLQKIGLLMVFRSLQVMQSFNFALLNQTQPLLPVQKQLQTVLIAQAHKILNTVKNNFFVHLKVQTLKKKDGLIVVKDQNLKKFRMNFAKILLRLAIETQQNRKTSVRRLDELLKLTSGKVKELPKSQVGQNILMLLLESDNLQISSNSDPVSQTIDIFKANQLAMSSFEYILVIQLLRRFQTSICLQQKQDVTVNLPSFLLMTSKLRNQELIRLSSVPCQPKYVQVSSATIEKLSSRTLQTCFEVFFCDEIALQQRATGPFTQNLDEFLLLQQFFSEVRSFQGANYSHVFAKLMQIMLTKNYSHQPSIAALAYVLKETRTVDLETPFPQHINCILKKQFLQKMSQEGNESYPKFLVFLLQNANQLPLAKFQKCKPFPVIPLDNKSLKLNNFLFEAFCLYTSHFKLSFEGLSMKALANAPSMEQGLLEAMTLEQPGDNTRNFHLKSANNLHLKKSQDQIDKAKTSVWEVILFLWLVQCKFMYRKISLEQVTDSFNKSVSTEAMEWFIRAVGVEKDLTSKKSLSNIQQMADALRRSDGASLRQLTELYWTSNDSSVLTQVSRKLIDSKFVDFTKKLPALLSHYAKNTLKHVEESNLFAKIRNRIHQNYWGHYVMFKEVFGLKLNYSIQEDVGTAHAKLVKRQDRRRFKQQGRKTELDTSRSIASSFVVEQLNNFDEPSKVLSNTGDISVIAHSADVSQDFDDRRNLFGDLGSKYEAKRAENSILEASLLTEEPPLLLSKKESFDPESLSQISFLKKQLEEHESRLKQIQNLQNYRLKAEREAKILKGLSKLDSFLWKKKTQVLYQAMFAVKSETILQRMHELQSEALEQQRQKLELNVTDDSTSLDQRTQITDQTLQTATNRGRGRAASPSFLGQSSRGHSRSRGSQTPSQERDEFRTIDSEQKYGTLTIDEEDEATDRTFQFERRENFQEKKASFQTQRKTRPKFQSFQQQTKPETERKAAIQSKHTRQHTYDDKNHFLNAADLDENQLANFVQGKLEEINTFGDSVRELSQVTEVPEVDVFSLKEAIRNLAKSAKPNKIQFLDVREHVDNLKTTRTPKAVFVKNPPKLLRTPEKAVKEERSQELYRARSPIAEALDKSKILRNIRLLRVPPPSQAKVVMLKPTGRGATYKYDVAARTPSLMHNLVVQQPELLDDWLISKPPRKTPHKPKFLLFK